MKEESLPLLKTKLDIRLLEHSYIYLKVNRTLWNKQRKRMYNKNIQNEKKKHRYNLNDVHTKIQPLMTAFSSKSMSW